MKKTLIIVGLSGLLAVLAIAIASGKARKSSSWKMFSKKPSGKDLTGLPSGIFPLMKGVKSLDVAFYQTLLNRMISTSGQGTPIMIDGIWGSQTEKASKDQFGWNTVDEGLYAVNVRTAKDELIELARKTQNVILK